MGRKFIRQAVAAWFQPPAVAGLNTVYTAPHRWAPGQDFFNAAAPGLPSGAVAFPYVEQSHRQRISMQGAPAGGKFSYYTVALVIRFKSNEGQVELAQDDHDDILDAMVVRLEQDKQLGTGPTFAVPNPVEQIFQAGEGDSPSGTDVHVMSDMPKLLQNGQVVIFSSIRFEVMEWIAGNTA